MSAPTRPRRPARPPRPADPPAAGGTRPSVLTRRASLNALAALVDYGARILLQLVLAPLMLTHLGAGGYGVWQVLQKLIGHATPAGGRPGEALKWTVAHAQGSPDQEAKRRQVGTAIAVWAMFLPLVVLLGGVLAWISPALTGAAENEVWTVRAAAGLLVVNLVLLGLAAVPQSVLLGENLGYRRLGLSTGILLLGGLLVAVALWTGTGLVGVAAATVVTTVLSGVTYWRIVRSQVRWWGVARPVRGALRGFVGLSWWFLLWNLVMQAIKGSDVIILGAVGGVTLVTTYTLTSYVPQAITDVVFMVISATMPGLGGVVGAGELDRAARIRGETMVLAWLVSASACATTLVWLPSFLGLWVGSRYDAGTVATLLICVMVLQMALFRVDSNVIDVTLRVRGKVLLGLGSVAVSAALAVLLVGPAGLGISGLLLGLVAGRLPLSVAYPWLVGRRLGVPVAAQVAAVGRPLATTVLLMAVGLGGRGALGTDRWWVLVPAGLATGAVLLGVAFVLGLPTRQRRAVLRRARKVVGAR